MLKTTRIMFRFWSDIIFVVLLLLYVSLTLNHEPPQVNSGLSVATMALLTNEVSSVLLTAKRGIIFGMSGSQEKC